MAPTASSSTPRHEQPDQLTPVAAGEPTPSSFRFPRVAILPVEDLSEAQCSSLLRLAPHIPRHPQVTPAGSSSSFAEQAAPTFRPAEADESDRVPSTARRHPLWQRAPSQEGGACPSFAGSLGPTGVAHSDDIGSQGAEGQDRRDAWLFYEELLLQEQQDAVVPCLDEDVLLHVFGPSRDIQ